MAQTIVTHIKRIDRITNVVKIMTVAEVIQEVGEESIDHLQNWGKMMTDDHVYHVIDTQDALIEILGKSVSFKMYDGQDHLIKVQGIGFTGVISGIDDEGMNINIHLHQVDEYRVVMPK